jgi:hypothetical protein
MMMIYTYEVSTVDMDDARFAEEHRRSIFADTTEDRNAILKAYLASVRPNRYARYRLIHARALTLHEQYVVEQVSALTPTQQTDALVPKFIHPTQARHNLPAGVSLADSIRAIDQSPTCDFMTDTPWVARWKSPDVQVVGELDISCPLCGAGVKQNCSIRPEELRQYPNIAIPPFHDARFWACLIGTPAAEQP